MRFLVEIYEGMRKALGASFPIGLKLNSSDFKEVVKKVFYSYDNPKCSQVLAKELINRHRYIKIPSIESITKRSHLALQLLFSSNPLLLIIYRTYYAHTHSSTLRI
ncbi:hypothetical protein GCM10020370_68160 [Paenibacillus hodogayensis]